ncbi:hypothetical protein OBBRIDRAFT_707408, partial [Obba rivulosa]
RRGALKKLPKIPIDILAEIFMNLDPWDLLKLARTTKALHHFPMSREFVWIWRAARKNVDGLPELPSYLSEVQYANLFFLPHCHVS